MRLSLEAHRGILSVVFRLKLIKNTRHCLQPLPTHQVAMYATLSTLPPSPLVGASPCPEGVPLTISLAVPQLSPEKGIVEGSVGEILRAKECTRVYTVVYT